MPQLDANTFLSQYSILICLLITVYILLSYVILPQILRALFIRANILYKSSTSDKLSPTSVLSLTKALRTNVTIAIIKGVLSKADFKNGSTNGNTYSKGLISVETYTDYLILALISFDSHEENNINVI